MLRHCGLGQADFADKFIHGSRSAHEEFNNCIARWAGNAFTKRLNLFAHIGHKNILAYAYIYARSGIKKPASYLASQLLPAGPEVDRTNTDRLCRSNYRR